MSANERFDCSVFKAYISHLGGQSGYNIPEVSRSNEVADFLHSGDNRITELEVRKSPEKILRLYEDASLCFYRHTEMNKYK